MTLPSFVQRFVEWVRRGGRLEVAILLALLVAVAGLWTFSVLAEEVVAGDTGKFDERVLIALRQPENLAVPIGPPWLLQVARDMTAFGGAFGIGLITLSVVGYLLLERRYGFFSLVVVSVYGGAALALLFKTWFHRSRPQVVPHLTDISTASFPSGHSMISSVAYLTLAALLARTAPDLRTKIYFLAVAVVLIVLIGCSRLYLGVHYPTDVLAGWAVGSAWAMICCLVAHFVANRRMVRSMGQDVASRPSCPK